MEGTIVKEVHIYQNKLSVSNDARYIHNMFTTIGHLYETYVLETIPRSEAAKNDKALG